MKVGDLVEALTNTGEWRRAWVMRYECRDDRSGTFEGCFVYWWEGSGAWVAVDNLRPLAEVER